MKMCIIQLCIIHEDGTKVLEGAGCRQTYFTCPTIKSQVNNTAKLLFFCGSMLSSRSEINLLLKIAYDLQRVREHR